MRRIFWHDLGHFWSDLKKKSPLNSASCRLVGGRAEIFDVFDARGRDGGLGPKLLNSPQLTNSRQILSTLRFNIITALTDCLACMGYKIAEATCE